MKHYDDPQVTVLRAALIPFLVIAAGSALGWGLGKGGHALLGVSVATVIVGLFFGSGFYIEKRVREAHPLTAMSLAMASFALKFMLLGGFLIGFRNTNLFDTDAFAITALALAFGWLTGEVRGFMKARFLYTDAGAKPTSTD